MAFLPETTVTLTVPEKPPGFIRMADVSKTREWLSIPVCTGRVQGRAGEAEAAGASGHAAMVLGLILGPVFAAIVPGMSILLAGFVGGALAWGGAKLIATRRTGT